MRTKRTNKLTDQLRYIVENCGQTRYQICKATRISQPTLARLVSGERFLSPTALDKLGKYLGLRIVADKPNKTKCKRKGR
jgi:transcriptional regulator with XRE-family HTH domain